MSNVLHGLQKATKALREGVATESQWAALAGRLETAKALADQGVLPGIKGHLGSAEEALQGIQARARMSNGWHPVALQYCELDAIETFVELHAYQVRSRQQSGRRFG